MTRYHSGIAAALAVGVLCTAPTLAHDTGAVSFRQLDTDQDGYVTKSEIEAKPTLTRTMQISTYGSFELADNDKDGRLTVQELAAFEEELPVE